MNLLFLNGKIKNGFSIIEVLIATVLIGALFTSFNFFYLQFMESLHKLRSETFVHHLHRNISNLLNSQNACLNSFNSTYFSPIANDASITAIRDRNNNIAVNFSTTGLNLNNVTIESAKISNLIAAGSNSFFDVLITYSYLNSTTSTSDKKISLRIPIQAKLTALNIVTACSTVGGNLIEKAFIRKDITDFKEGSLTINGNLNLVNAATTLNLDVNNPAAGAPHLRLTNIGNSSDLNLKYDIKKIEISNIPFSKIGTYTFFYENNNKKQIGFLAEEIQPFFPYAVRKTKDGLLSVNYNAILPFIWEYHKSLIEKRAELEKRLLKIENRLNKKSL